MDDIVIVIKLADTGERFTYHADSSAEELKGNSELSTLELARLAVMKIYEDKGRPIKRCLAGIAT